VLRTLKKKQQTKGDYLNDIETQEKDLTEEKKKSIVRNLERSCKSGGSDGTPEWTGESRRNLESLLSLGRSRVRDEKVSCHLPIGKRQNKLPASGRGS